MVGTAALFIFLLTYVGAAIGRIPCLRPDRAGIALLGGAAMIAVGAISMEDAYRAINFDTITLLLGMMIVVAHLKVSGAFRTLGGFAIGLVMVTLLTGVLSAFLVNDVICLVMALNVVHVTRVINRNPVPYLIATCTASSARSSSSSSSAWSPSSSSYASPTGPNSRAPPSSAPKSIAAAC